MNNQGRRSNGWGAVKELMAMKTYKKQKNLANYVVFAQQESLLC